MNQRPLEEYPSHAAGARINHHTTCRPKYTASDSTLIARHITTDMTDSPYTGIWGDSTDTLPRPQMIFGPSAEHTTMSSQVSSELNDANFNSLFTSEEGANQKDSADTRSSASSCASCFSAPLLEGGFNNHWTSSDTQQYTSSQCDQSLDNGGIIMNPDSTNIAPDIFEGIMRCVTATLEAKFEAFEKRLEAKGAFLLK
jgi:hypothetical protein